ncbi:MMPL family transporter [Glycomyces algeriensis]|uniref:Membrane protein n=2 Tax=Glycomyces algeriensis TaxID=256037 RepID=A0A9W6G7X5_9ACTN|nr:MMPL family transporter [Glycomyces algeriensis]MDA1364793.1 MMPL family transporter [Glycomyces algeriensis]MDR7350148.1 RND superfamily putative drug exporter [Glycomyces algeriensis]GLI42860.1 membrane protein [Glycomyces algeriensis]
MAEFLYRVGRWCARRAKTVIAAWALLLAAAAAAFALFGGTLTTAFSIPDTPTEAVTEQLKDAIPAAAGGTGTIVLSTASGEPFSAEQQAQISDLVARAGDLDGVETAVDPFATEAERAAQAQAIADGRTQIETARAELDAAQDQLDLAREQAGDSAELDAQQAQVDAGLAELDAQSAALEQGATLLDLASGITLVSADGSAAVVSIAFTEPQMEVTPETKASVTDLFDDDPIDGVEADYSSDMLESVPSVFGAGEVVGLVVAAVALIVMLGTLIGAALPLLTALVGVGVGAMTTMSLSGVIDMASVTPVLGLMLGLAVGIDYALFIVNRHRRQLKEGYDLDESIALATGTSGNAVVFAGATVLIALAALNVTGIPFLGLMGSVGALCVAVAVLVAVTFIPALLSLAGMRILRRSERAALDAEHPAPGTAGGPEVKAMRTPSALLRVLVGIGALLVVAIPAMDMRLNLPDGSSEAHDTTQYQAYATVAERFGEGQNGPLLVVATLPGSPDEAAAQAAQLQIAQAVADQDGVVAVAPIGTSEDRTVAAFQVLPESGPTSEATEALVHTLRGLEIDGVDSIGVAGNASGNIDISEKLSDALPVYLGVVVGLSLLILILVFRSIFVPVAATLGFVLSYFAALGGVVAIYQWGWLADVFGVDSPGPILNFLPTLLVGILFGLAMDYMLFLGSGMREAYAHGVPARLAVVHGLRAGRSVVTAAAIIMIAVFGGFVFSHSAMIRPIGFALAFGVLVDAFLVRMLIIPALMHLFGDKVWWLPKWLDRLLPDVDVEGAALERRHPHADRESVTTS